MITIRTEIPADVTVIHEINTRAFGQPGEGNLIDALREQGALVDSLVAVSKDADNNQESIVGHLAVSPVTITNQGVESRALGLGPMSVSPDYQNQGIGSQLVRYWFSHCANASDQLLVVLGHPEFYPRFGFKPANEFGIRWEIDVPPEVFMVAELNPGALDRIQGVVKYHPAFSLVS
jgi:putative acetyltransferase